MLANDDVNRLLSTSCRVAELIGNSLLSERKDLCPKVNLVLLLIE